ncbi:acyl-CoA dehydrogenase family protein [Gordonia iterans]
MNLATSAEQRAAADAVSGWAQARGTRTAARLMIDDGPTVDGVAPWRRWWPELGDLGAFAAGVDDALGGAGGDFADTAAILAACGAELVPGPVAASAAAAALLARAGAPQAAALLGGERPAAVPASALSAPTPVTEGRGGTLSADLGPVPGYADGALVVAHLAFGADTGWFAIDPDSSAIVRSADAGGVVDGTAPPVRVVLEGLRPEALIRLPGEEAETLLVACLAAYQAGVARRTLDLAVEYAKVRTQFDAPIGSFQAIKHLCADMLCRAEQTEAAAWDLAAMIDDDVPDRQAELSRLATAALVAELPLANAKDAIQILGGIGFTFEHDAHLYLRSALAARVVLGGGGAARRRLAGLGRSGVRREFAVDLAAVEDRRREIAALVAQAAAVPEEQRRAELARTGLLMPHWPAPYGLQAGPALQLLVDAELDAAGVRRPDLVIAGWALPTILEHGTPEQRERFLGPTLAGEITWCQLFSEPEAGSDLAALRTRAERVPGGWELTGQKVWTSQARESQWAVCLARTDQDASKHKGITYFLVDMSSAGIDIRPLRELTGRALFNEVFLDRVFVPDELIVGEVNGGWRLARTTLSNERVAMGGSGLGKELDALLRQLDESGAPLTAAQEERLGGLIADAHIGRVLDARALLSRLSGTDPGATSSVRKLIGVVHWQAVPEFALDLLGEQALVPSTASEFFLLNRCLSIAGGTTQILKTAAAERILGLPRSPRSG